MGDKQNIQNSGTNSGDWKKTLLASGAILVLAAGVTAVIFSTEPTAQRTGATKETAMLVDVTNVERGTYRPTITAMGTVRPARDIILSPRISGEIIERSDNFVPGGFVEKGETLLQIDPADYENTLKQRQSELRQAISDLNMEMGRQDVAKQDYQLLEDTLTGENKALVLREPQLNAARARVEAARAAVEQAELELQRTHIKSPFDAHILTRNVNIGSQVAPGDNLGRLVGMDTYWVETTVPLTELRWLSFPNSPNNRGSEVQVRNRTAWPEGAYRTGYLYRQVGTLEEKTRMARVLVSIPDPLAYRSPSPDVPSLMIGAFLETRIQGEKLNNVIRLNRDYIRKDDTVWIMENRQLRIRNVDIVFRDAQHAYIREGLSDGDQVVTTNLATVVDGAKLRLSSSAKTAKQDSLEETVPQEISAVQPSPGGDSK